MEKLAKTISIHAICEMELLNNLAIDLEGKCDWYSLSWNAYSYL